MSPWRNRLARSAVNRKVGGSSPPGDGFFFVYNTSPIPAGLFTSRLNFAIVSFFSLGHE